MQRLQAELSPALLILGALMILILPLQWFVALLVAMTIHELFHFAAIYLLGGRIWKISFGMDGIRIAISPMSYGREFICALAGPLGGLILIYFGRWFPRVAICAAAQTLYNLLPLYPLDGGRALRCASLILLPEKAPTICRISKYCCMIAMIFLAFQMILSRYFGILPAACVIVLVLRAMNRNIPCKANGKIVQ
jgi:Zn-dependent protease